MSFAPPRLRSMFEQAMRSRQVGFVTETNALYDQIFAGTCAASSAGRPVLPRQHPYADGPFR